ncbi:hypothetical protein D3C80_1200490 [compost metagenome]
MGSFRDLSGQIFGRLTVIDRAPNKGGRTMWNYLCECGNSGSTASYYLTTGGTTSCGCFHREMIGRMGRDQATHGATRGGKLTATYSSWSAMRERVLSKTHHAYARYGGRGIEICERWLVGEGLLSGYECFLEDMGERPDGHSIDRIDTNGNYEPGNCRWATPAMQARNAVDNKMSGMDVGILHAMVANDNSPLSTMADRFGISKQHAWRIKTGQRWAA